MLKKTKGGESCWECDNCGDAAYSGTLEFADAWQQLKDQGWRAVKDEDDEWTHFCPDCAG